MKFLISFIYNDTQSNPNKLFGIFKSENGSLEFIDLPESEHLNFCHGMGICYTANFLCGGIIPIRDRLTSYLLIINIETGEKKYNKLNLTKAIHGLIAIDHYRLLATSTQTDIITEIALDKDGNVLFEDILFDLKDENYYKQLFGYATISYLSCDYRSNTKMDDLVHCNSLVLHDHKLYISVFNHTKLFPEINGAIISLPDKKPIKTNLHHPHTVKFNKKGELLICESRTYKFINLTRNISFDCCGYTRGICETKSGYWVGVSKYRQFSKTENKWIDGVEDKINIKGAMLHYIDHNLKNSIIYDLSEYGVQEIFDIIQLNKGKYK